MDETKILFLRILEEAHLAYCRLVIIYITDHYSAQSVFRSRLYDAVEGTTNRFK